MKNIKKENALHERAVLLKVEVYTEHCSRPANIKATI